jgi:hypothetical protein
MRTDLDSRNGFSPYLVVVGPTVQRTVTVIRLITIRSIDEVRCRSL